MTWWLDPPRLPEILGETFVALVAASAVSIILVRDWRERHLKSRQAAAGLVSQPDGCDPIKEGEGRLIRMTLLADVNEPGEVEKAEAWLSTHQDRLTYLSEQGGCGCCIVDWDMEGPREVIETLPNSLRCGSDWTRGERGYNHDHCS